jgi:hypothetical protein
MLPARDAAVRDSLLPRRKSMHRPDWRHLLQPEWPPLHLDRRGDETAAGKVLRVRKHLLRSYTRAPDGRHRDVLREGTLLQGAVLPGERDLRQRRLLPQVRRQGRVLQARPGLLR